MHNKGRDITLITSDKLSESAYSDFKTADLVKAEKIFDEKLKQRRKTGAYLSSIGAFISLMILSLSFMLGSLIYVSIILLLASMTSLFYFRLSKPYTIIYSPIFRIKVFDSTSGENPNSTELIHSKIFIIDESLCFLGSVNLTHSGFKTHYVKMLAKTLAS